MNIYLSSLIFSVIFKVVYGLSKNYVNATVFCMLSLDGPLSYFPYLLPMLNLWKEHLGERAKNDPAWPVNITVEFQNGMGDVDYGVELFLNRTKNTSLPAISVVIGPENRAGGAVGVVADKIGMPVVLIETTPFSKPSTSFFVVPWTMYKARAAIDLFVQIGIQSLVIFIMWEDSETYNIETCGQAGDLAASRGILVTKIIIQNRDITIDGYVSIIKKARDSYHPDAMLFCDWESCQISNNFPRNPLYAFKKANYLPKALFMMDCLNIFEDPIFKNLYQYVITGTFSTSKCIGLDYTEDATPFSSYFRTKNAVNLTLTQSLNVGWIPEYPSSAKLFVDWYRTMSGTNATPIDEDPALWAVFDVVESALYRAALIPDLIADQFLSPKEIHQILYKSDITTPFGRVIFDNNNVNTYAATIVVQSNPFTEQSEIIAPTSQASATFIYPMPTWDERVYTWSLFKYSEVTTAMYIAAMCTFILLIIIITVIVNRSDIEIRMLHYRHMTLMCLAAMSICWSVVFIWQADVQVWQCQYYPWTSYLPASFMINIANLKAYRLSTFLHYSSTADKKNRQNPFSHWKVFLYSLGLTSITFLLLLISTFIDPLKITMIIIDKYRPSTNYHHCSAGIISTTISSFLVISHIIGSIYCIYEVRNGYEAYRDGTVLKEAFLSLYGLLCIALIMNTLSLSPPTTYLIRCICLCLSVLIFCIRLLGSRCIKFWIPNILQQWLKSVYSKYLKQMVDRLTIDKISEQLKKSRVRANGRRGGGGGSARSSGSGGGSGRSIQERFLGSGKIDNDDSPLYAINIPQDSHLLEMEKAIADPSRYILFETVAKTYQLDENIHFLKAVLEYKLKSSKFLHQQSNEVSNQMKEVGKKIMDLHIGTTSLEEINISAKSNGNLLKLWQEWQSDLPIISIDAAKHILQQKDSMRRVEIFDEVYKEISILLYQNIWSKFRTLETQQQLLGANNIMNSRDQLLNYSSASSTATAATTTTTTTTNTTASTSTTATTNFRTSQIWVSNKNVAKSNQID